MKEAITEIADETLCDLISIKSGMFAPLSGFMAEDDFYAVVNNQTLSDYKTIFTFPITLDVSPYIYDSVTEGDFLTLKNNGDLCGEIIIESKYMIEDADDVFNKVFGTADDSHPGVRFEKTRYPYRVGGKVMSVKVKYLGDWISPETMKGFFKKRETWLCPQRQNLYPLRNENI